MQLTGCEMQDSSLSTEIAGLRLLITGGSGFIGARLSGEQRLWAR